MANSQIQTLSQLHARTWAELGTCEDDWAQGPRLIARLREIEAEIADQPIYTMADVLALCRVAETWCDVDDGTAPLLAALARGVKTVARIAPGGRP